MILRKSNYLLANSERFIQYINFQNLIGRFYRLDNMQLNSKCSSENITQAYVSIAQTCTKITLQTKKLNNSFKITQLAATLGVTGS